MEALAVILVLALLTKAGAPTPTPQPPTGPGAGTGAGGPGGPSLMDLAKGAGGAAGGLLPAGFVATQLTSLAAHLGPGVAVPSATVGAQAIGGVTAYLAGNALLGAGIVGDWSGAATALAFAAPTGISAGVPVSVGNIGNVGRVVGKAIDRLLGGVAGGLSSGILEAAGYFAGAGIGAFGMSAVPFIGQVFAVVIFVVGFISDRGRLAYGQAGIISDITATAQEYFLRTRRAMTDAVCAGLNIAESALDQAALDMIAVRAASVAQGWVYEENEARKRMHRLQRWGLTVTSEAEHMKWAADRGVFVEDMTPVYRYVVGLAAAKASSSSAGFVGFTLTATGTLVPDYPAARTLWDTYLGWESAEDYAYGDQGAFFSNATRYLQAMKETWGTSSAATHANHWLGLGAFEGAVDGSGNVAFKGLRVLWSESLTAKRIVAVPA